MKSCPKCHTTHPDELETCPVDGEKLVLSEKTLAGGSTAGAQSSSDPLLGQLFDNKYQIIKKLGGGGMGAVYQAEHVIMNRMVALKIIHHHLSEDEKRLEFTKRFETEARTASKLDHPNAITIHDFGTYAGNPYLVMEFVEGQSLKQFLKDYGEPMPLELIAEFLKQICSAVGEAHHLGIVHRDMKPDNVVVSKRRDGSYHLTVLDFGLAKVLNANSLDQTAITRSGEILGTPHYMSPEQIRGQDVDSRTDLYAIAVMTYEMLTGDLPFQSSSLTDLLLKQVTEPPTPVRTLNPALAIPPEIEHCVMTALSKNPAERQKSLDEFLNPFLLQTGGMPASLPQPATSVRPAVSGRGAKTASALPAAPQTYQSHNGRNAALILGVLSLLIGGAYLAIEGLIPPAETSATVSEPGSRDVPATDVAVNQTAVDQPTAVDIRTAPPEVQATPEAPPPAEQEPVDRSQQLAALEAKAKAETYRQRLFEQPKKVESRIPAAIAKVNELTAKAAAGDDSDSEAALREAKRDLALLQAAQEAMQNQIFLGEEAIQLDAKLKSAEALFSERQFALAQPIYEQAAESGEQLFKKSIEIVTVLAAKKSSDGKRDQWELALKGRKKSAALDRLREETSSKSAQFDTEFRNAFDRGDYSNARITASQIADTYESALSDLRRVAGQTIGPGPGVQRRSSERRQVPRSRRSDDRLRDEIRRKEAELRRAEREMQDTNERLRRIERQNDFLDIFR